jgi:hypothetical protein
MSLKNLLKRLILESIGEGSDIEIDLDLTQPISCQGFKPMNPKINQYAQSSPEALAEMLIFVQVTMQQSWDNVVAAFPVVMDFIKKYGGLNPSELLNKEKSIEKGKPFYNYPPEIAKVLQGGQLEASSFVWNNRDSIYSRLIPSIKKYNRNKDNKQLIATEDAAFELYLKLLELPGLLFPKAAFAVQLIIGKLGCIDSINIQIYNKIKGSNNLFQIDDKGKHIFKSIKSPKKNIEGFKNLETVHVKFARDYVNFLNEIAALAGGKDASPMLWDAWVKIVAAKINKAGPNSSLNILIPDDDKETRIINIKNAYAYKPSETSIARADKFREKYKGKITPQDVSRQHFPPEMDRLDERKKRRRY